MQTPAQSRTPSASAGDAAARSPSAAGGACPGSPQPETAPTSLQPLDYTSLRAVLSELDPALVPSRFEKAQQSDPHTLQLGLRTLQGSQWLELSWLAEAPRLLAIPPPPRLGEGSTLAQQLQHGLRGLALVELHQPAWERVVELRFAARPGGLVERTLVLELMGRHSNLFLLDAERRVITLARQVRDSQSRLRPIGTGDPYQAPPAQTGEPPRRQEAFEAWRQRLSLLPLPLGKALLGAYQGTSPALVRQLLEAVDGAGSSLAARPVAELEEAQWHRLWLGWRGWLRDLEQRRFVLAWGDGGAYRCWTAVTEPEDTAPANVAVGQPGGSEPAARDQQDPEQPGRGTVVVAPFACDQAPPLPGPLPGPLHGPQPGGGTLEDPSRAGEQAPRQPGLPSGQDGAVGAVSGCLEAGEGAAACGGRVASPAVAAGPGLARAAAVPGAPPGTAGSDDRPHPRSGAGCSGDAGSGGDGLPGDLPINRALAAHYGGILAARRWRQRRQALENRLQAAIEREQRQLEQQKALLAEVPAAEGLQRRADALLCQADPDRETITEAQALYRRARRLRRSAAAITPRIDLHRQRLAGLETSLTFLEQMEFDPLEPQSGDGALSALDEELQAQLERLRPRVEGGRGGGRSRAQRRQGGQAEPRPLELRSAGGLRLQVGRNHRQNEWISLRQARRGDLWFHAQEQPGSHVVLKGSEAPPQETDLQEAADLAAHFSRGRGNRRVPVLMVDVETLQRIPGAEPGTVRHRGGEVRWGEPERALALLRRADPRPAGLPGAAAAGPSVAGAP